MTADVLYLRPAPLPPVLRSYTLAPLARRTIWVNGEDPALAATDVAGHITASAPIVVERSMYRDVASPPQPLGLGTAGAGVDLAPRWFLAEGATGPFFDLYYLMLNPGLATTTVRVTYLLDDGPPIVKTYALAAQSRRTISVAQEDPRLANTSVSAVVETLDDSGIVVERSMYWPGGGQWQEGHVTAVATATARRWGISGAELRDTNDTETFVLIANTSATSGTADVLVWVAGSDIRPFAGRRVNLAANSRVTVRLRDLLPPTITEGHFTVGVESDGPEIVVERATYSNANGVTWAAGSSVLATPLP